MPRLLCLALLALSCFATVRAAQTSAGPRVPQWGRFEAEIPNENRYANPFRDVALDVTYTAPDGRTIPFWGFYDGGPVWRIRFMPDTPGTWRYEAKFTETSVAHVSAVPTAGRIFTALQGTFECVPSDIPGQLVVHAANPQWFGWRGGDAMLIRAFHIGDRFFASNWPDAKRTAFLDWAQQQGYNTLSIASHYLNRHVPGRGEGWDTPRLWPLDPGEYQHMERILADLERRKIVVYPFAGFFGRESNFPGAHGDQTRYIRYTLARLAPSWNLLWNVGGPEPLLRNRTYLTFEEVNRLGTEIAKLDPFKHPISVHHFTADNPFHDRPWLTYGTLQGPKTFDRALLRDGLLRNSRPGKPLLAQETLWSGNSVHIRANKGADYSDADLRKNAYVIHFSASYLVFADNNGDSSTGFTGSMELSERRQPRHDIIKHVWDTVAPLPWSRTVPRPDLVATTQGGPNAFCLADPGRTYLVYLEARGPVNVAVTGGPYRVEWIDAQNAANRHRGPGTQDGQGLTPPAAGDDWILVLQK